MQPAIREELMISVGRGSRSSEIAWSRVEGRKPGAERAEKEKESDFSGG